VTFIVFIENVLDNEVIILLAHFHVITYNNQGTGPVPLVRSFLLSDSFQWK